MSWLETRQEQKVLRNLLSQGCNVVTINDDKTTRITKQGACRIARDLTSTKACSVGIVVADQHGVLDAFASGWRFVNCMVSRNLLPLTIQQVIVIPASTYTPAYAAALANTNAVMLYDELGAGTDICLPRFAPGVFNIYAYDGHVHYFPAVQWLKELSKKTGKWEWRENADKVLGLLKLNKQYA